MDVKKALVFDIWGNYAHFKKIYVTTSALTYSVPFKTTIYGIVGAIIGLDNKNNSYLKYFDEHNCRLAIQIVNPVKIQRVNINLSPKPGPIRGNRKPTTMEYIINPHYRVFFSHTDEIIFSKLKKNLRNKESVYTPVLGLAHCLANFKLIGEYDVEKDFGNASIGTVLLKSEVKSLDTSSWTEDQVHIQEQSMYPLEMNTTREVIKRDDILFDLNGHPIQADVESFYKVPLQEKAVNVIMM